MSMNKRELFKEVCAIFDGVLRSDLRGKDLEELMKKVYIDPFRKRKKLTDESRPVILTAPLYASDDSYSSYVNQNVNNEMFQQLMLNKPRLIVKNTQDFYKKYFLNDSFTFKE